MQQKLQQRRLPRYLLPSSTAQDPFTLLQARHSIAVQQTPYLYPPPEALKGGGRQVHVRVPHKTVAAGSIHLVPH